MSGSVFLPIQIRNLMIVPEADMSLMKLAEVTLALIPIVPLGTNTVLLSKFLKVLGCDKSADLSAD